MLRKSFQTLLPVTAFICKVLMAPCKEKRNSVGNLRTLGVLGNCCLSSTENSPGKERAKGTWMEQDGVTDAKLWAGGDGSSPSVPPQTLEETGPASIRNSGEGQCPSHLPLVAAAAKMNHQPLPLCPFFVPFFLNLIPAFVRADPRPRESDTAPFHVGLIFITMCNDCSKSPCFCM